jgi:hypothetical protein
MTRLPIPSPFPNKRHDKQPSPDSKLNNSYYCPARFAVR